MEGHTGRRVRTLPVSFDEFVALRLDPLLRYATVLTCDSHQAHDIVQEVMLRAQQRWSRIGALDAPAAYVKRMITNEFLSWRRRMSRREIAAPPATMTALGPTGADPAVGYTERDAMLARIAKLPR